MNYKFLILLYIFGSCTDLAPDIVPYNVPNVYDEIIELCNYVINQIYNIICSDFIEDLCIIICTCFYNFSLYIDQNSYIWFLNFVNVRDYIHTGHSVSDSVSSVRVSIIYTAFVSTVVLCFVFFHFAPFARTTATSYGK